MKLAAPLLALVFAVPAAAQTHPFQPGERIRWEVEYLGMTVGSFDVLVREEFRDDRLLWPIQLSGATRGFAWRLAQVEESFTSLFEPQSARPVGSDRNQRNNDFRQQEWIRFNTDGRAYIKTVKPETSYDQYLDVPTQAHDPLSAVYYVRGRDLSPGNAFRFPVFTGRRHFELEARVVGRERIRTALGEYDAVKVACRTGFTGKFEASREIEIWFSDDANRVPLKIRADFVLGSVRAEVVEYVPGMVAQRGGKTGGAVQ